MINKKETNLKVTSFAVSVQKNPTKNPSIYNILRLVAWTVGKRIIDQESDVPSIIFYILFIDLGHSKLFIFIFVIS